jgi:hypothetical protein
MEIGDVRHTSVEFESCRAGVGGQRDAFPQVPMHRLRFIQ